MLRTLTICLALFLVSVGLSAQIKTAFFDTLSKEPIGFDDSTNLKYLSIQSGSIWHIATPQKSGMTAAWSAPNVLVSDSINPYPTNNTSHFDLSLGSFNLAWYPMMIGVAFMHQIDTDSLRDGGYISASWDNGLTFRNVANDSGYLYSSWGSTPLGTWDVFGFNRNLYSDSSILFNGEPGFTGRSQVWTETSLAWYIIPIKKAFPPDTMWLRFSFVSDSIFDNRQGWMIDDINIYSIELPGSVKDGVSDAGKAIVFPNPAAESASIRLDRTYEKVEVCLMDMEGRILSKAEFHNQGSMEYSLEGIASGSYVLRISCDGKGQQSLRLQVISSY